MTLIKSFLLSLLFISQVAKSVSELNRGNGSEVDSLNIHLAQGLNSHNVLRDIYEGLMTLDIDGKPVYGVASSHQVDNNIWSFKLSKEHKWSDGSPVTANDFVRSWRQACDPGTLAPYGFLFHNIKNGMAIQNGNLPPESLGVKAINDFHLEVELASKDSDFLEKLSLPVFFPLSPSSDSQSIISNGAYKLKQRVLQEKIVLEKNPFHPSVESIYFDRVIYWVTENQSSELKRYRAGELDITESIPDSQIHWIKENLKPQELRVHPYLGSFFLGLNFNHSQLQNLNLRRALFHAIDRNILVEKVLKSGQLPAFHIVPQPLLETDMMEVSRSEQISIAKQYLKDSGYKPHEVKLQILYNSSQNQKKVALAVAAMWRQVLGIRSQLKNQEWKVFTQTRKSNDKQVFRSGWIADYSSALSFLELFESDSRFNFYNFQNSEFDHLIKLARKAGTDTEKKKLLLEAQSLILKELPVIPLYYYVSRHMVKIHIKGYKNNISDRHLSRYIYKDER